MLSKNGSSDRAGKPGPAMFGMGVRLPECGLLQSRDKPQHCQRCCSCHR